MTDKEFITEIKRALVIMMRAMIRKYGLAWADLLPREHEALIATLPNVDIAAVSS